MTAAETALLQAQQLVTLGRWNDALTALEPALADDATAAPAACLVAQCQLGLGRVREAEVAAKSALARDPSLSVAHQLLALVNLRNGTIRGPRVRTALEHAREGVRLAPSSPFALRVLARAQMAVGDRAGAARSAEHALALAPDASSAHAAAGYVALGSGDLTQAEQHFRAGLGVEPDQADLALGLGETLRRQGRVDDAAGAFLAAGRSDPSDSRARRGLSTLGIGALGRRQFWVPALLVTVVLAESLANNNSVDTTSTSPFGTAPAPAHHPFLGGHPLRLAIIFAVAELILGAIVFTLRIRATRGLPDDVRSGLRVDHVNNALTWLRSGSVVVLGCALWAALAPAADGGGATPAIVLAILGAIAAWASVALHRGPRAYHWRRGRRHRL